jgi:hypothetical protein
MVALRDGRALDSGIVEGEINYPQRCWDERGLEEKFRWLAEPVLERGQVDAVIDMVWHLEDVQDSGELVALLLTNLPESCSEH